MTVELLHWEVGLAADLTSWFAEMRMIVVATDERTNLTEKLVLRDLFETIAGLVETRVTIVAIYYKILRIALSAETNLTICLE